jgi:ubiquinone/menaquinone biosynthesis C-methylase UbiE
MGCDLNWIEQQGMVKSSTWDAISDRVEFTASLNLPLLSSLLNAKARVLDLGCGYGRIAAQLHNQGFINVIGYDSAPQLISRGLSEFPSLNLKVADAGAIPESDHSFDAIVVCTLFTSIPDAIQRASVIREMQRLLSPGGVVFGTDFLIQDGIDYSADGRFLSSAGVEMKHFHEWEIEAMFSDFIAWQCSRESTVSLSGTPAEILQYSAKRR